MPTLEVSQQTFRSSVVDSDTPVLVDFWAPWCQPCLQLAPTLDELATELDGQATIAKVNIEQERGLAAMFQVMSIPALLVFKEGKVVREFTGVQSKETLRTALIGQG